MLDRPHALERAEERLRGTGLDPARVYSDAARIALDTSRYWRSAAVLMASLATLHGDTSMDILSRDSNGDEVWAVCRGGRVATIMLRRAEQPHRPENFGVEMVLRVAA